MNTLEWIGSIFLNGLDISDSVIKIELTEDLFSPYPVGYMLLEDKPSTNIIARIGKDGVIGKGEEINLVFQAKIGNYIQEIQSYYIYKVETLTPDDPNLVSQKVNYRLFFAPQTMFINELIKVNRYYEKKLSDIVSEIAEGFLQVTMEEVEPTNKVLAIYFPKLNPIECIQILSSRSITAENGKDANYVFYGDIDHKYYYVTLGKLMEKEPIIGTHDYDGIKIESAYGFNYLGTGKIDESPAKYHAIRYQVKPYSPIKHMVHSMFSSALLEYDVVRRKYRKFNFNYWDDFEETRHLIEEKPILSKEADFISLSAINPDAFLHYYTCSLWQQNTSETEDARFLSTNDGKYHILPRKSHIQQLNQMGLEIEIPGNAQIKIGNPVFFGRPKLDLSPPAQDAELRRNPFVTGKFLLTRKTTVLENSKQNNTTGFNLKTIFSLRKDSDIGTEASGGASSEQNDLDIGVIE